MQAICVTRLNRDTKKTYLNIFLAKKDILYIENYKLI